jgi:hypothetical protein
MQLLQLSTMAPRLKVAILAGSTSWLDAKPNNHPYNPQAHIGWDAFHYGFIAAEWQHEQAEYYRTKSNNSTDPNSSEDDETIIEIDQDEVTPKKKKIVKTGTVWSSKLIEFLWLQMKRAWKERSDKLHDRDGTIAKQRRREEISKKITALYELKPLLSAADQPLLDSKSLYYRLNQKTHQMEHWYDNNVRVIHFCVQQHKERTRKGNRDIRNFFDRVDRDTDDTSDTDTTSNHAPQDDISLSNQSVIEDTTINPTDPLLPITTARTTTSKHRDNTTIQKNQTDNTNNIIPRNHRDNDSDTNSNNSDSDADSDEDSTVATPRFHKPDESTTTDQSNTIKSTTQSQVSTSDNSITSISESSYQPSEPSCQTPAKKQNTASKPASTLARNHRILPNSTRRSTSRATNINSSSNHSLRRTHDQCTTRTPPPSTSRLPMTRSSMKHSRNRHPRNQNDAAPAAKRQRQNQITPQAARLARPKWDKLPAMTPEELQRHAKKKRCLQTLVAHRKQRKTNDISIFDLYFNDQSNI